MNKISKYMVYVYIAPIIVSLYFIYNTGYLLGDFRSYSYSLGFTEASSIFLFYMLPLLFIYCMVKISGHVYIYDCENKRLDVIFFRLLLLTGIITLLFGANQIGQVAQTGFSGLMIKIASKLNPLAILPLLTFSAISHRKFLVSVMIVIFFSYMQHSLQGIFISILCIGAYYIVNNKINRITLNFLFILPLIFIGPLLDLISYVYTLRNEMRGVAFDSNEILSLTIGRISTTSSLIEILHNNYFSQSVSDFFSLGIMLERLLGITLFDTTSPSNIFNLAIVGQDAGYSIFMGMPGFLAFLMKGDVTSFIFNVIIISLVLVSIYLLIPVFNRRYRIVAFFLIMYLSFLSFDIWEISIAFQTVVLWRIILLFNNLSFRRI
ncbi:MULTISPECIES: oligosaccharide repeat unit polymerase [Enterobacter]|nr:oligosaccharide repeat unit polymerase [Enterobacter asburiae]EHN8759132.1 oligosaccharide repeat unit polymerase [Enterobacter asburiae]MCW7770033.1 oligosaccharide repeat unit polymerase [Enterobacter asburiae]RNV99989.1 hypothetical protein CAF89_004430 [Enterobacter asburiae]